MDLKDAKILLVGAGNMGGALLSAWLHVGKKPQDISVLEVDAARADAYENRGIKIIRHSFDPTQIPDCIVLAVKPQSMDTILPQLASAYGNKSLYLSIAAGKTLNYFIKHFGIAPIVRAMPNTPAIIGKGITALYANSRVNDAQKKLSDALMKVCGQTVWLTDESQMDVVTALSGSGPAYVYLFMELLIKAGVAQGLPEELAKKLVLETVHGSAELARKSGESLNQLRANVTSPGGTTEAALQKFMENDNFGTLLRFALAEAVKRSKELASS